MKKQSKAPARRSGPLVYKGQLNIAVVGHERKCGLRRHDKTCVCQSHTASDISFNRDPTNKQNPNTVCVYVKSTEFGYVKTTDAAAGRVAPLLELRHTDFVLEPTRPILHVSLKIWSSEVAVKISQKFSACLDDVGVEKPIADMDIQLVARTIHMRDLLTLCIRKSVTGADVPVPAAVVLEVEDGKSSSETKSATQDPRVRTDCRYWLASHVRARGLLIALYCMYSQCKSNQYVYWFTDFCRPARSVCFVPAN